MEYLLEHAIQQLFEARNKPDRNRLHIVPFRDRSEVPESEWITVTDGSFFDDKPRWSPDGNLLYFVSYRDGFLCIWAIRLDAVSKKPAGVPFPVQHFHRQRLSLVNAALASLTVPVAKDKLIFGLGERTGNVWLGEFQTR